ncbi:MAG TPA: VWA domain-containing protein [Bryobacteraceae bacterium]|nr:VWA domain-containing protein [Bryobacteraceae bacterium]
MHNRTLPLIFATLAAASAQVNLEPRSVKHPATPPPDIKVESNLVLVPVSVVDRMNHPVLGLERENFRVFDEKAERPITAFAMEDEPVAIGLIFDHSASVAGIHRVESETTRTFLGTSNPEDDYFLVDFGSEAKLSVPLTNGTGEVRYRILTTKWGGATALLDAVALGLKELHKSKLTRKALLVVTDGGDNHSRYTRTELANLVEETDALIYPIALESTDSNFGLLKWMADTSGGRLIFVRQDLPDIAAKIALELRNRYVLGFPADQMAHDGKSHSLHVDLITPRGLTGLRATWRRSYRAPDN